MKKTAIAILLFIGVFTQLVAQTSDNNFREPLKEVLNDIEHQYDVKLRISGGSIEGKMLDYAKWRYRPDVEQTLKNVLAPFDMVAIPDGAPGKYKIEGFRYHRRTVEQGQETLDFLASKYSNKKEWEKRRANLKDCLLDAVRLSPLPENPESEPVLTPVRKYKGYTVQNIGLEVLPGVYVAGSIYRPAKIKGKIPVVLCPNGHFGNGRYNENIQARCAGLARMGALAVSYDLFAWGESTLQFDGSAHRKSLANTVQVLNSIRLLDYVLSFDYTDADRVGITGGSGGGSHAILMAAIDDRIDVSVPAVMMSAIHYGGCPCESGNPIHLCEGGTNNVELAGIFAPKLQLVISDGGDWTSNVPDMEFPFLKRIYSFYGDKAVVKNAHFPDEGHDYGPSKREAMYRFMAKHLDLDETKLFNRKGELNESDVTIEEQKKLKAFGENGENLPDHAIFGFASLEKMFQNKNKSTSWDGTGQRYKIGVCDWMILKRQKLGAFARTHEIGADGLLLDMGGLGSRPTFDSKLFDPKMRGKFKEELNKYHLEVAGIAMSGFYAQNFAARDVEPMIDDCINTMKLMGTNVAFLPLGVEGDLVKHPERRDSIVKKLHMAGEKAKAVGVVIGIETALDAKGELQLLREINSDGIKIYYNVANALQNERDLYNEIATLGAENICQILITDEDGVWLENNKRVDMYKVKETLDRMGWGGWLVIERSRDQNNPHDVVGNFGANTRYLKKVFQE